MLEIVAAGQITGDSWQAYSWRWALCYLLAANPNYRSQFKRLGVAMMNEENGATFENAYGTVAQEISFEYNQFVKQFGNGYRADLCAWDWQVKPHTIKGTDRVKLEVNAAGGWQATELEIREGNSYDFVAQGKWKTSEEADSVDGNGDFSGIGRLVAAILTKSDEGVYSLSDPIDLGAKGSFTAPSDGQIFVRCDDAWTELGDNDGAVQLFFRATPKE